MAPLVVGRPLLTIPVSCHAEKTNKRDRGPTEGGKERGMVQRGKVGLMTEISSPLNRLVSLFSQVVNVVLASFAKKWWELCLLLLKCAHVSSLTRRIFGLSFRSPGGATSKAFVLI